MKNAVIWDVMPSGEVSEERIFCIIRVTRIGELGGTLAVSSNRSTLRKTTFFLLRIY
jgi:hypothetical protein